MTRRLALASIAIPASASEVFSFVAEFGNLPRWAPGFAPQVEGRANGRFDVIREGERIPIELARSRQWGVVDFRRQSKGSAAGGAYLRVIPLSAEECAVVMLVPVAAGADGETLQQAVEEELDGLRAALADRGGGEL